MDTPSHTDPEAKNTVPLVQPVPAVPTAFAGGTENTAEASASAAQSQVQEVPATPENLMGGQAVLDGVLMRNGGQYALAVRLPSGPIVVRRRKWVSLIRGGIWKKPFLRGFPLLVETLVNGVKGLNTSVELSETDPSATPSEKLSEAALLGTLIFSVVLALALFVLLPHLLTLGMQYLGFSSGLEGIVFHLWDGFFKFAIFIAYIAGISYMPEIRTVFQYHGAEHKVIGAYESKAFQNGAPLTSKMATHYSRLHPRCGTTFILFVLALAIVFHAVLVPPFLWLIKPSSAFATHTFTIFFKVLLMIPISAVAYEIIRYGARLGNGPLGQIIRGPGLLLQLLSTREPTREQIEVALVALRESLPASMQNRIECEPYSLG